MVHRVKLKEKGKTYQNLVQELKNLWNMRFMVLPIINGALGTVSKAAKGVLR